VKFRNGSTVLLEMKGAEFDMDHDFMVCEDPLALPGMLAKMPGREE
jgi:hypothetical protein